MRTSPQFSPMYATTGATRLAPSVHSRSQPSVRPPRSAMNRGRATRICRNCHDRRTHGAARVLAGNGDRLVHDDRDRGGRALVPDVRLARLDGGTYPAPARAGGPAPTP